MPIRFLRSLRLLLALSPLFALGCAELDELRARTSVQELDIARLRADNAELEQAYFEANEGRAKETEELNRRITRLNEDLNRSMEDKGKRQRDLEVQVRNLTLGLESQRAESSARIEKTQLDYKRVAAALEEVRQKKQATEDRLAELTQAESEARGRVAQLEGEVEAQRATVTNLQEAKAKGDTQLTELKKGRIKAEARLQEISVSLEAERTKLGQATGEISRLKSEQGEAQSTLEALEAIRSENKALRAEGGELRAEIEGLKNSTGGEGPPTAIEPILQNASDAIRTAASQSPGGEAVTTELLPEGLRVILPNDLLFDTGTVLLREQSKPILVDIAQVIASVLPGRLLVIEGHTDNQPVFDLPFADNWGLGNARADAVRKFLAEDGGLPLDSVGVSTRSYHAPRGDNATPEGRALNRRVELFFPSSP